MNRRELSRRRFLGTTAALAAPAFVPGSLIGRERVGGMPSPETFRKVDEVVRYVCYSMFPLRPTGTQVVPHFKQYCYGVEIVLHHAGARIFSIPQCVSEMERKQLRAALPGEACDPAFLARVFAPRPADVWPAVRIGIADRKSLKQTWSNVRALTPADGPALKKMLDRCRDLDVGRFKPDFVPRPLLGRFQGEDLVAVSRFIPVSKDFASISTLAPLNHRGKGHVDAVAGAAAAAAVAQGHIAMWQTSSAQGDVERGESVGFHPYATTIHVELGEDDF